MRRPLDLFEPEPQGDLLDRPAPRKPAPISTDGLNRKLSALLLQWDRIQETRSHRHNRYALGLYLQAADEACTDVAAGYGVHDALRRCFNDRLLDYLLKHVDGPMPRG